MGKFNSSGADQAASVVSGAFTGTGASANTAFYGAFNVAVWGTFNATVALQRSFDGGVTWINAGADALGTPVLIPTACSFWTVEPEVGVLYQLNCTSFTSGTVNYRMSASFARTTDSTN